MTSSRTNIRDALYVLVLCAAMLGGVRFVSAATTTPIYTLGTLPDRVVYNDFVVGPGKIEVDMDPGESRTIELTIANRLGTEKSFNLTVEDFTSSNNPNQPVVLLGDDRGPYSLKDFIHVAAGSVDIPHAEKAFVPVMISIPADAQPGGLYGSVIVAVTTRPATSTAEANAAAAQNPIITRLATLFFVKVNGPVKEEGQLKQFQLAGGHRFLFNSGPITFDLVFQNTGDMFLVPHGSISVSNMLGSSMGAATVDPWFAMPQSLRFREVNWAAPFLFGRYTAHANIYRGYGSTTDDMELVFWVIPWKIILMFFIGLVVIIFAIRWIVTHFKFVSKK